MEGNLLETRLAEWDLQHQNNLSAWRGEMRTGIFPVNDCATARSPRFFQILGGEGPFFVLLGRWAVNT
jgi:hypothetical protein